MAFDGHGVLRILLQPSRFLLELRLSLSGQVVAVEAEVDGVADILIEVIDAARSDRTVAGRRARLSGATGTLGGRCFDRLIRRASRQQQSCSQDRQDLETHFYILSSSF